jgi:hypothetical protein
MSIRWAPDARDAVDTILIAHPAPSGRCFHAARAIHPIACHLDPRARAWKVTPRVGRFIVPKRDIGQRWFHHITVEVDDHGVDALTGPDGTPWPDYLPTHWLHDHHLQCTEADLTGEEP